MRALMLVMLAAAPAFAWDGNMLWEEAPNDFSGGGGVWGTGGKGDHGIQCTSCHVRPAGVPTPRVDLTFAFNPQPQTVGTAQAYRPGQRYQVTVTLTGEWRGTSGCDPGMPNLNGFGAAFELGSGARAGRYETDSGQDSNACPPTIPGNDLTMSFTTITYARCHAVAYTGMPGRRSWTFWWTAPAAGSGNVTVFWGVVDGDCDMNSQGDDAKAGSFVLAEGIASAPSIRKSDPVRGAHAPARPLVNPRPELASLPAGRCTRRFSPGG